jgi:hypothetical protein
MRLALCGLLVSHALLFAQPEQRTFSAEDDHVQRPIEIPASIMTMLAQDLDVTELLSPGQKLPSSWFLASEVHLKDRERDIVLIGAFPILGANVTTFWIFRPQGNGFQLLLKVVAHTIYVLGSRTAGYYDIEAASATAVIVNTGTYKFTGEKYTLSRSKTRELR